MASVKALTYLGVRGPDLDEWRSFAGEVLGMQVAAESTDEVLYLRMDDRAYRLSVEKGAAGLSRLGFEVATRADLDELSAVLRSAGVAVTEDPVLAAIRRVKLLVRCQDPAGNDVELVVGALSSTEPFASPRGVTFKTGDQGVGHVFMLVPDEQETWHFYVDLLGFRLSDTIDFGLGGGTFLHCNPRHHTLAFVPVPGMSALLHFMVEVDSLESVGRGYDIVQERKMPISLTLGMHTNDHMVSFYVKTPSGFDLEYGTAGREIDDDVWTVGHYDSVSYWGHKRENQPA